MSEFYILKGREVVPCTLAQWVAYTETERYRHIADTNKKGARVSTIFLGLNHSMGDGIEIFETMIFGGEHDQYQKRYATYGEAEKGHKEACKLAYK